MGKIKGWTGLFNLSCQRLKEYFWIKIHEEDDKKPPYYISKGDGNSQFTDIKEQK